MSDNSDNPYAAPASSMELDAELAVDSGDEVLAGRFTRFAAALVDGILMLAIIFPVQFATGNLQRTMRQEAGIGEQLLMPLFGIGVMLALNGYLLANRGQTIGKLLTNIQIVDFETSRLLPFLRVYIFRYLWHLPLSVLVALIPGTIDDSLVSFIFLIDAVMIFGGNRRCLHDLIAGSKVVLYKKDRPKLA